MKVTVLGCGGSGGVPVADGSPEGDWGACDPTNPRNRRTRVSVLVETQGQSILIDTSPDLRQQILDNGIERIDAVLFTHAHADHCHGLDELRGLSRTQRGPIPAYMAPNTHETLSLRFDYAFESSRNPENIYPALYLDRVVESDFQVGPVTVQPFVQDHGPETSLGFRIGAMAYSTDVVRLDEAAFATLEGIELWVVDALRDRPHPTHTHIAQTLEWIERLKPARAVLTHMNQEVDYAELAARCPAGVEPGYDGLTIELPDA